MGEQLTWLSSSLSRDRIKYTFHTKIQGFAESDDWKNVPPVLEYFCLLLQGIASSS